MYDVEISGSITAHKTAKNHNELREIATRALGTISVAYKNVEIFIGTPNQLLDQLDIAEELGYQFYALIDTY
jgi:tryptophan 2,3-dioxygenase